MRLAVVSPFVDRRHGTERALAELIERLAQDHHCKIHLYAERVEDLALVDGETAASHDSGCIIWHKVFAIPGPHLAKFLGWIFANRLLRLWHRLSRGLGFDLVLSPGINCLDADVIIVHAVFHRLRELARKKESAETRPSSYFRDLHRRLYYALLTALERRTYSDRAVALAAVSQRTADLLARYFRRADVRVIPNGVDSREFDASARSARRPEARRVRNLVDTDFLLLLIGNDWRVKGLPVILRAMAQLRSLPLHLLVVGSDAADPFRETADRFGLLDRCHWETPRRDVIEFYAAADLYVSPTLEDSFGLPVAEAMACGLPVITSANAGISGWIHNSVDGFILPDPEDPQTLARVIERLYRDTPFRLGIGEAAVRTASQLSWNQSAAQVWELLQEVAKARAARASR